MVLKHWILPIDHFKTHLFFNFWVGGPFSAWILGLNNIQNLFHGEGGSDAYTLFLAAMSSSRSDIVTKFVRLSVRVFVFPSLFFLFVSLAFYLFLKSFNGVSRKF